MWKFPFIVQTVLNNQTHKIHTEEQCYFPLNLMQHAESGFIMHWKQHSEMREAYSRTEYVNVSPRKTQFQITKFECHLVFIQKLFTDLILMKLWVKRIHKLWSTICKKFLVFLLYVWSCKTRLWRPYNLKLSFSGKKTPSNSCQNVRRKVSSRTCGFKILVLERTLIPTPKAALPEKLHRLSKETKRDFPKRLTLYSQQSLIIEIQSFFPFLWKRVTGLDSSLRHLFSSLNC